MTIVGMRQQVAQHKKEADAAQARLNVSASSLHDELTSCRQRLQRLEAESEATSVENQQLRKLLLERDDQIRFLTSKHLVR